MDKIVVFWRKCNEWMGTIPLPLDNRLVLRFFAPLAGLGVRGVQHIAAGRGDAAFGGRRRLWTVASGSNDGRLGTLGAVIIVPAEIIAPMGSAD